jgi:hypothetical protein
MLILAVLRHYLYILLLFYCLASEAQKRDYNWVFGDSVGIDFNTVPPTVDTNRIINTEEAAASISDNNGNLLFYIGTPSINQSLSSSHKYVVRSSSDSIMQGGDSLAGHSSMSQGVLILPNPKDSNEYFILHIDHPGNILYYSMVDMSFNGGKGQIILSNYFLATGMFEKLHAVKAGNGKDWWIISMGGTTQHYFYIYKIDSMGLSLKSIYPLSSSSSGESGQFVFSRDGSQLISAGAFGPTILYDFDRCLGVFSNPIVIDQYYFTAGSNARYGCSFSPSGRYVYLSSIDSLWQFDTQASNIASSKQLLFATSNLTYYIGQHMLGPDSKIYIGTSYSYPDNSPVDSFTTHLSVINNPDSGGTACNIQPYSFSLLGRKTYVGLPNFPNYNLGPIENLNCDSILAAGISSTENLNFNMYPNPAENNFTIEFNKGNQSSVEIELFNTEGKLLSSVSVKESSKVIFDVSPFNSGIYFVKITSTHSWPSGRKLIINK